MIPNLLAATVEYWHQLDELEAAYQSGDISLEEVDARVKTLMAGLGQQRRASLRFLRDSIGHFLRDRQDVVVGLGLMTVLSYAWFVVS